MDHTKLKQFAQMVLDASANGNDLTIPDLSCESKHWKKCFQAFSDWYDRFRSGTLTAKDCATIYARNGNKKLPFLSFSSLPFFDCPGKGDCANWCYSPKGWRNVHPFFRQLRNSILVRHRFDIVRGEMERLLALKSYRKGDLVPFRLYVDGDFPSSEVLADWMELIKANKQLRAYGYSKSWELLIAHKAQWPANYLVNLSGGSKYHANSGIARAVKSLPCVRGEFLAVGKKAKGIEYNTPEYRAQAREHIKAQGIGRSFVCPGTCGDCTPQGHFCGSSNKAAVVILAH